MTKLVIWLVRDTVRLEDNPALELACRTALSEQAALCPLALLEPRRWSATQWGLPRTGSAWQQFRLEGLLALQEALAARSIPLCCMACEITDALTRLQAYGQIHLVVTDVPVSMEERAENAAIRDLGLCVTEVSTDELFTEAQLPFSVAQLPIPFTRFRKVIEATSGLAPSVPSALPSQWPPGLSEAPERLEQARLTSGAGDSRQTSAFTGGSAAGQSAWREYLGAGALSHYKQTRNAFEGRHQSSGLSPWLAHGNLSVRQIWHETLSYEADQGANESTYWLRFELLWREFFRWYARRAGVALFAATGPEGRTIALGDGSMSWQQWCQGTTGEPIVDACLRELTHTGWLSNRGRQLAASACLAQCAVDWRQGAAYFESQLIDFDVASNWGNWAYIAGVGPDPRGGRIFNLADQAELYDPQGRYRARWLT
ncbi:MAG: DASH family cryptochrome [Litorivicinaceae bacterium]